MTSSSEVTPRRRGPRRRPGAPAGPDEVRRAVLDAASALFAARGVDRVSLRDIAAAADVSLALINRYMGSRDELVGAVLDDLSDQVSRSLEQSPLLAQSYEADSAISRFVRILGALAIAGEPLVGRVGFNPVLVLAETIQDAYGLDADAARIRAAQVVASAFGWRIFEGYLVAAGDLHSVPLATLRDEQARAFRRLGATPLPSPPDPPVRQR